MALEVLHDYLRQTGRYLLISGSNPDVTKVLQNSGMLKRIGAENIFPAEVNPTASTRKALLRAKALLPQESPEIRIFYDREKAPHEDETRPFMLAGGSCTGRVEIRSLSLEKSGPLRESKAEKVNRVTLATDLRRKTGQLTKPLCQPAYAKLLRPVHCVV